MADTLTLRSRLFALRADTLDQLAEADRIQPGYLALLADTDAALRILAAEPVELPGELPADAELAERIVLIDDGEAVRLATYAGTNCVAAVELSPTRALTVARSLLDAALRRLPR
jgi:hypothetical protein